MSQACSPFSPPSLLRFGWLDLVLCCLGFGWCQTFYGYLLALRLHSRCEMPSDVASPSWCFWVQKLLASALKLRAVFMARSNWYLVSLCWSSALELEEACFEEMEEPTRVAVWCFCFDSESDGSFSFFFPDFLGNLAYVKSNGCSWLGFIGLTSFLLVRMLPFTQALLWGLQEFILGLWPFQPLVFLLRAQVYDSEGRLLPFYVVHSIRKILNFDFPSCAYLLDSPYPWVRFSFQSPTPQFFGLFL